MSTEMKFDSGTKKLGYAYCCQLVRDQLVAVESGDFKLRIPNDTKLMRLVPNLHFHLMPEMNFQISGSVSIHMPSNRATILPGTTCILRKGLPHRAETRQYKGQPFLFFVVEHFTSYIGVILSQGQSNTWPMPIYSKHFSPTENSRLVGYLNDITVAWDRGLAVDRKANLGLLLAYWAGLLDVLVTNQSNNPHDSKSAHPKVHRCRQMVMGNISDPNLSVRLLARWVQLAPDYLSHLFCQQTGMPLKTYINEQRIALAKDLLSDDRTLNISEIAWASGFSDPGYFARVFKRTTGFSPRVFRNSIAADIL
ncbi:MAG TPA: AraC family transcriptional regulator [Phycisphaerae bacterium]|nr:AraC family transcriptional regulator [Phycisphaerae bacterium]